MKFIRGTLLVILIGILPMVLPVVAWSPWWLAITAALWFAMANRNTAWLVAITLAVIGGFAISHEVVKLAIPGATVANGFLYPVIYWAVCLTLLGAPVTPVIPPKEGA